MLNMWRDGGSVVAMGLNVSLYRVYEQQAVQTLRQLGLLHKHNPSRQEIEAALGVLFARITLRWADYNVIKIK